MVLVIIKNRSVLKYGLAGSQMFSLSWYQPLTEIKLTLYVLHEFAVGSEEGNLNQISSLRTIGFILFRAANLRKCNAAFVVYSSFLNL